MNFQRISIGDANSVQTEGPTDAAGVEALRCCLTGRIMIDPAIAADGYSYERQVPRVHRNDACVLY